MAQTHHTYHTRTHAHTHEQSGEFKALQENLANLTQAQGSLSTNVSTLSQALASAATELDGVKAQMDAIGVGMTDSAPLSGIKTAYGRLKGDVRQMDLRVGVIQHTLVLTKMRGKFGAAGLGEGMSGDLFGGGGWGSQVM